MSERHVLSLKTNKIITESVLKRLNQNRLTSVLDFLTVEIQKLSTITKLSIQQILVIRNDLLNKFSGVIKGDNILDKTNNKLFISTGIASLNAMCNGGLPRQKITEICGLAGSGTTQLCMYIAIELTKIVQHRVLYIDTKGDFSAVGILKILERNNLSQPEMASTMERIKVARVWNMSEIVELLNQLKHEKLYLVDLCLIIVDSLPCLMFQGLGEESKTSLTLLNKFVNLARHISVINNLAFICTNIQTRWIEQTAPDLEEQETVPQELDKYIEKKHRCLGRYWQHVPALVLELERNHNNSQITATTVKSTYCPHGSSSIFTLT